MSGAGGTSRWPWLVVVAAAVIAFLGGVGTSLAAPAPAPSPSSSSSAASPVAGPGVLAELRRAQQPGDRPRIAVGTQLRLSTFRILDNGSVADLYVARDRHRRICLVAVTIDDHFAAACGADPKGLSAPLLLRYTATGPGGSDPIQVLASVDATG